VAQLVSGAQEEPLLVNASVVGLQPHLPAVGVFSENEDRHPVQAAVLSSQVVQFAAQFAHVFGVVEVILYCEVVQVQVFGVSLYVNVGKHWVHFPV
jgi:hypothetical protein